MDWFSENALALAGLGGFATVVAAVVAVATLMRAGLDSASRTRPYVVVEYRLSKNAYNNMILVVRNAGPTAARNVSVSFDPPFVDSEDPGQLASYVARRYAQPIAAIAPSQEFTSVLHADLEHDERNDVPEILVATVRYASPWWRARPYRDKFELQRVVYAQQIFTSSSDSLRGRMKTIAETFKKAEANQRSTNEALTDLARVVSETSLLLAPQKPGVEWRARHINGHVYAIDNLGDQAASQVTLSAASDNVVELRTPTDPQDIGPKEALEFFAYARRATGTMRVKIEWATKSAQADRHELIVRLPNV